MTEAGYKTGKDPYFDTVVVEVPCADAVVKKAQQHDILLRYVDGTHISVSFNETDSSDDLKNLLAVFNIEKDMSDLDARASNSIPDAFKRTGKILDYPIFNDYPSEHLMTRYLHKLETKDLSLNYSMITLGSCTMKLNGVSTMMPITWPEFANIHPYAPKETARGYQQMIKDMNDMYALSLSVTP